MSMHRACHSTMHFLTNKGHFRLENCVFYEGSMRITRLRRRLKCASAASLMGRQFAALECRDIFRAHVAGEPLPMEPYRG